MAIGSRNFSLRAKLSLGRGSDSKSLCSRFPFLSRKCITLCVSVGGNPGTRVPPPLNRTFTWLALNY